MRLLSPSRTGSKQNKTLRLFKQLEFLLVGQALRLPISKTATGAVALQFKGRDHALEEKSRNLLRQLGAAKLAREIRVEWNPHLQTAAGRADFRKKVISLNPRLSDHGVRAGLAVDEIDRTLRHELAHLLALDDGESLRTARNGARLAAISTLPMKRVATICRSLRNLSRLDLFMSVRVVMKNFRACVAFAARSRVSPVAENTTVANSTRGFGYS